MHHMVSFIFNNIMSNIFMVQLLIMNNMLYVAHASSIYVVLLLVFKSETRKPITDNKVENRWHHLIHWQNYKLIVPIRLDEND